MKMLLRREGRWTIVSEEIPAELSVDWVAKDEKAQSTICLGLDDSQIVHVSNCETTRDMWLALQKVHERANLASKMYLLRKFYKTELKTGQHMQDYVRETLELVEKLRGVGKTIDDFDVAAILLSGLPEEYETLVTALEARPDEEITLEYVKGKLADEYRKKNKTTEIARSSKQNDHALKMKQITPRQSKGGISDNRIQQGDFRRCFFCGKLGHIKRDCYFWKMKNKELKGNPKKEEKEKVKRALEDKRANEEEYCFKTGEDKENWYIDSGATSHMTGNKSFFVKLSETERDNIHQADGSCLPVKGIGEGYLSCLDGHDEIIKIRVSSVLYVPNLDGGLISVKKLAQNGFVVVFRDNVCSIMKGDKVVATAYGDKGLYALCLTGHVKVASEPKIKECIHTWHKRLGHRDPTTVKLLENRLVDGMKIENCGLTQVCIGCVQGKMTEKPYPKVRSDDTKEPLEIIHSDVCGPMRTKTPSGNRYMLIFIDDYSRYTVVYLIKSKEEVFECWRTYVRAVETKFNRIPKVLRSDNGTEYTNRQMQDFMKQSGIVHQTSVPYSPQQNGLAERKNRSLIEAARCMLKDVNLQDKYWGEAVLTACYIQNRLSHKALKKTPYELWNGKKPTISHMRIFGSKVHVFIPREKRSKFDSCSFGGVFVGYSDTQKGYRILDQKTDRVTIHRTVQFEEPTHYQDKQMVGETAIEANDKKEEINQTDVEVFIEEDSHVIGADEETVDTEQEQVLRRSQRINKGVPPRKLTYLAHELVTSEPSTWDDVQKLTKIEKEKWILAMQEELKALEKNDTWSLTELPPGKEAVENRWVFAVKPGKQGEGPCYKARLVAKGYTQTYGKDYRETYAPVANQVTIRTILTVAAKRDMIVKHIDVKSAFLNSLLEEEIYMYQPEGYVQEDKKNLVCKLNKSLYGLKQSARAWNMKMNEVLTNEGFVRSDADKCLYSKREGEKWTYLTLHVDDMMLATDLGDDEINNLLCRLNEILEVKDLGRISYFLGMEISRESDGSFSIKQEQKIDSLVKLCGVEDAKGANTSMDISYLKTLNEDSGLLENNIKYSQVVGSLLYLSTTSRPDIANAVCLLSRRTNKPRQMDWNAVKRVVRYLKTTKDKKLQLGRTKGTTLDAFSDADWGEDRLDRKSTSGGIFLLGTSLIYWYSKKQKIVALSTTEAEYVAASCAAQEIIWIRQLLKDIGLEQQNATVLHEDNQGCIKLVNSEKATARSKHIDIRFHYLKDLQSEGQLKLVYCATEDMLADLMTKPLGLKKFGDLCKRIGLT